MQSIGDSSPIVNTIVGCCSHCDKTQLFESHYPELRIYSIDQSKKRRVAEWEVTESLGKTLKERLLQERHIYVQDHPAFLFLGEEAVCPESIIDNICTNSKFIKTKEDIDCIFGLRSELSDKFLNILLDVLSSSPASTKRQRKR